MSGGKRNAGNLGRWTLLCSICGRCQPIPKDREAIESLICADCWNLVPSVLVDGVRRRMKLCVGSEVTREGFVHLVSA